MIKNKKNDVNFHFKSFLSYPHVQVERSKHKYGINIEAWRQTGQYKKTHLTKQTKYHDETYSQKYKHTNTQAL